jgi:hypothetical protein
VPKNAQLPAEKAALHQLGEEGLDQIEIESLLEVAMWQIAVAAGDVAKRRRLDHEQSERAAAVRGQLTFVPLPQFELLRNHGATSAVCMSCVHSCDPTRFRRKDDSSFHTPVEVLRHLRSARNLVGVAPEAGLGGVGGR